MFVNRVKSLTIIVAMVLPFPSLAVIASE